MQSSGPGCWPSEAGRHELDKFRERVAAIGAEYRSTLSRVKPFLARNGAQNETFGHSHLHEWAFGEVTQDLLTTGERCTLVSH